MKIFICSDSLVQYITKHLLGVLYSFPFTIYIWVYCIFIKHKKEDFHHYACIEWNLEYNNSAFCCNEFYGTHTVVSCLNKDLIIILTRDRSNESIQDYFMSQIRFSCKIIPGDYDKLRESVCTDRITRIFRC